MPPPIIIDLDTGRDALICGKRLLKQVVAQLDTVPVLVLGALFHHDAVVIDAALLVRKQSRLDPRPSIGSDSADIVRHTCVISRFYLAVALLLILLVLQSGL